MMLLLALFAAGAMSAIVVVFLRRLRRIEEEVWGEAAHGPGFMARLRALLRRRPAPPAENSRAR